MAVQGHSPNCPGMAATGTQVVSRAHSFNAVVRLRTCAFKTRAFVRNRFGENSIMGKTGAKLALVGTKCPPHIVKTIRTGVPADFPFPPDRAKSQNRRNY